MATIIVRGTFCKAVLTEPDEDGDYSFEAACGATSGDWGWQPIGDMLVAAEQHVDSAWTTGNPDLHRSED